ncbi:MAG: hypothetical protein ACXWC9_08315 [Pseudobdellovibrionaceae bacterium]
MKMKANLVIGLVLLASFLLALAIGTGHLSSEKEVQTNNEQMKNQQDVSLLDLCKEKKTVTFDIIPSIGACTEMVCDTTEPCCNSCSVRWNIKETGLPAWGAGLPSCRVDGCGKYLSPACTETKATGILKNCDSLFTMEFEVSAPETSPNE